jgi:uncharacterized protein YcnI
MTPPPLPLAAAAALLAASFGAAAHVTLEEPAAIAGKPYKAVLRVGHGCEGTATHTLAVRIPAGFKGAKPMPKPGWAIEIRPVADSVEIVWKASSREAFLPDAHYDEFVLRGRTPEQPGPLWFKVQQLCEKGQWDWAETPASGTSTKGLKAPAALLEVLPGMGGAGASTSGEHRH